MLCHVNVIIVLSPLNKIIEFLYKVILKEISLTDIGRINTFSGYTININTNTKTLSISKLLFTNNILDRYNKRSLKWPYTPYTY